MNESINCGHHRGMTPAEMPELLVVVHMQLAEINRAARLGAALCQQLLLIRR